jgi:hypothetical protein
MSISATTSAGSTPTSVTGNTNGKATSKAASSDKAAATAATTTTTPQPSKEGTSSTGSAQDAHFNVQMPTQPVSNGLGQTIGQHLNLRA